MIDIRSPKHQVQVLIREDGRTLWVNVDGKCELRICAIEPDLITIDDDRKQGVAVTRSTIRNADQREDG